MKNSGTDTFTWNLSCRRPAAVKRQQLLFNPKNILQCFLCLFRKSRRCAHMMSDLYFNENTKTHKTTNLLTLTATGNNSKKTKHYYRCKTKWVTPKNTRLSFLGRKMETKVSFCSCVFSFTLDWFWNNFVLFVAFLIQIKDKTFFSENDWMEKVTEGIQLLLIANLKTLTGKAE